MPQLTDFLPTFSQETVAFDNGYSAPSAPTTHTVQPIVTGTSVLGIKYNGGVILAADTLGSYGSLARFRDLRRITVMGQNILIGASGDYSDFQKIQEILEDVVEEDYCLDDGRSHTPKEIYSYLGRVLYNRRNKMDPLWNTLLIAGLEGGAPFLGQVELLGTQYEDDTLATGFGAHIARPLLRNAYRPDLTEEEAKKVVLECMRVLFYRDARTINRIQIAVVNAEGATVSEPFSFETNWSIGLKAGEN